MNIWEKIQSYLINGHHLCLLTVIQSRGSSPGRRGFKMVVVDNGNLYGSIGGGLMEHNLVELAKENLQKKNYKPFLKPQTHNKKSKNSSGMICSGSQTISFNYFDSSHLTLIEQLLSQAFMIELSSGGFSIIETCQEQETVINSEVDWSYSETIISKTRLHLFGGGHVSLPTSELLTKLGFEVLLYDNRAHINTFQENQFVDSKHIIDYQNGVDCLNFKADDYVILMTHKCAEDMLILSQVIDKKLKYIGVLGSKNKIKLMFNHLLEKGFCKDKLENVHAPIGLPIKSQTTEEIAVSIAAELIQFKNS